MELDLSDTSTYSPVKMPHDQHGFYIDVANTVLTILFVHFYINEVKDQNSLIPCLFIQMSQSN